MDGWIGIVEDSSSTGALCRAHSGPCGTPAWFAGLFFASFVFVGAFVVRVIPGQMPSVNCAGTWL